LQRLYDGKQGRSEGIRTQSLDCPTNRKWIASESRLGLRWRKKQLRKKRKKSKFVQYWKSWKPP
jgi:hypothetical protein